MADVPNLARLSELIGLIYDAALDRGRWPDFLAQLSRSFGSDQALLANVDTLPGPGGMLQPFNLDLDVIAQWHGSKEHDDPWYRGIQQSQQDFAYRGRDLCPTSALKNSPFYIDSLRHLDIEHTLGGVSFESNARSWGFAIYRDKRSGPFTEKQKRTYELLIPHFGRAVRASQAIGRMRTATDSLKAALERVSHGVFVVDRNAHVIWMNGRAETIALARDGIAIRYGSLRFWDHAIDTRFGLDVKTAVRSMVEEQCDSAGVFRIPRPSGKRPYHMLVNPLSSSSLWTGDPFCSACVVIVHDPASRQTISPWLLERLYSLTPAEAQLCTALFETGSLAASLDVLEISRNTAKTHLARIFEKLGVGSQAQLLRRLALGFLRGPGDA